MIEICLSIFLYLYFIYDLNPLFFNKNFLHAFLKFCIFVYITFNQTFYLITPTISKVTCDLDWYKKPIFQNLIIFILNKLANLFRWYVLEISSSILLFNMISF